MHRSVDVFGAGHRVDTSDLDRQLDNVTYRRLGHAPDIEGLTDRRIIVGREQCAGNGVIDVSEAARLLARIVEQGPASVEDPVKALRDYEDRVLARSVHIEVANNRHRQSVRRAHRENEMLGHGLAGAVTPPCSSRRTEYTIVVLGERRVRVLPEHLRCAGEHHASSVPATQFKDVSSANHVHVEYPKRVLDIVLDTDNC